MDGEEENSTTAEDAQRLKATSDNAPRTAEMTQEITTDGRELCQRSVELPGCGRQPGPDVLTSGGGQPRSCTRPEGPGARTDEVGAVSRSRLTRLSEGGLSGAGCSWRDCSGPTPAHWPIRSFQACMQVQQEAWSARARPLPPPHSKADVVPSHLASAPGWLSPRHTPRAAAILAPWGRLGPQNATSGPWIIREFRRCKLRARENRHMGASRGRRHEKMDGCAATVVLQSVNRAHCMACGGMRS